MKTTNNLRVVRTDFVIDRSQPTGRTGGLIGLALVVVSVVGFIAWFF